MTRYLLFFALLSSAYGVSASVQSDADRTCCQTGVCFNFSNRLLSQPCDFIGYLRIGENTPRQIDTIRTYRQGYCRAIKAQELSLALAYCDSLIGYTERIRIQKPLILDAYRKRAELLKALNRDLEACNAYVRAIREQDTLMRHTETDVVRDMQTTYELDRMALAQATLKARHHKAALVSSVVLLLVVLCTVTFFYLSNRRTKRLQAELLRKIRQARTSEAQKSAFINSICHEIRTPLNCITGFSELLCSGEITPDLHDQYYEIIQQSRSQLRFAFNDMLDVAYLENLEGKLPRNQMNITALCRAQLHIAGIRHPKAGVLMDSEMPDGEIEICSNEKYLAVLVLELLGNALKFSDSGTVCLACSVLGEDNVTISVTDTGCGIPREQQEYVFERFTKLDSFRQGNGLGLYLCRLIVRHLGGQIAIDPDYTAGTRVVVTLPRK